MHPPSRARRIFKWTGVGLCIVLIVLSVFSLKYEIESSHGDWQLWLDGSGVTITPFSNNAHFLSVRKHNLRGLTFQRPYFLLGGNGKAPFVQIPHWLLFMVTAIPTAWLWHRDRRLISCSPDHMLCIRCGYDLTGNTSGVCSECGERTPVTVGSNARGPIEANG